MQTTAYFQISYFHKTTTITKTSLSLSYCIVFFCHSANTVARDGVSRFTLPPSCALWLLPHLAPLPSALLLPASGETPAPNPSSWLLPLARASHHPSPFFDADPQLEILSYF